MRSNRGGARGRRTLLLASVKNADEARSALEGGADILDAKDPAAGALGACSPSALLAIVAERDAALRESGAPRRIPVSAALGDAPDLPGALALAAAGAVACGADDLKFGLRGVADEGEAIRLGRAIVRAARRCAPPGRRLRVVLVAYAEAESIGSLPPRVLPRVAASAEADGCLIDTALKDGRTLFDHLGEADLEPFLRACRRRGLLCALAGSLALGDLPRLLALAPDLIGLRGALCGDGRQGRLEAERVRRFREALHGGPPESGVQGAALRG